MGNYFLWAFFIASVAMAADPAPINQGGTTFVPPSAQSSSTVQNRLNAASTTPTNTNGASGNKTSPTQIQVPTPDTIPAPSVTQTQSLGQYRTKTGEVKVSQMLLDRYKESVVRVSAKDLSGNTLAQAMGVGVGRGTQYIAAPLSVILGNSQQWADKIEITHQAGNKYGAKIALIDEERNIVLLSPEASPASLTFVSPQDERPQVQVYTISLSTGAAGLEAKIHRGLLAAANGDTGVLSISGSDGAIDDGQAGTGILNSQGQLVGMLLPGNRGVLSSTIQRLILKAQKATPIAPSLLGAILGRGVLVAPNMEGAFPTISAALQAIKKGEAPKTDPTRYTPAKNRSLAPKESDKVVVKVMPGTYKEEKTIFLPDNLSLSGSGPDSTILIGSSPEKPVILVQKSNNVMIAGLRVVPAPLQKLKAPTIIVSKSSSVTVLGNVLEAKGGLALWVSQSPRVGVYGNSFPRGEQRALSCDRSDMKIEANSFLGDWTQAVSLEKKCTADISRNLFFETKTGINTSALTGKINFQRNSFIRTPAAIKWNSTKSNNFTLIDNLFYECNYGFYSNTRVDSRSIGRNAIWQTKFVTKGKSLHPMDTIRTEPAFENPEYYDFRIKLGKGQVGVSSLQPGEDLGAFNRSDLLGPYTQQFINTLSTSVGEPQLANTWGVQ